MAFVRVTASRLQLAAFGYQLGRTGKTYRISGSGGGFNFNVSVDEVPVTLSVKVEVTCP